MIESLGLFISVYAGALALWAAVEAIRNRPATQVLVGATTVLELACVAQALAAVIELLQGAELEERTVNLTYLLVSVGLLPAGTGLARGDESRWSSGVIGVAAFVLLVVNWRLHATWSTSG